MVAISTVVESGTVTWVDRTKFLKQASLGNDPTFIARVSVALAQVAQTTAAAYLASVGPTTPEKLGYIFAVTVLKDLQVWAPRFAMMLVALNAINRNSDDADLVYWIQQNWTMYASVAS